MLKEFVSDLRRRAPLERGESDMARLLTLAVGTPVGLPQLRQPGRYTRTHAYGDDRFEVLVLDWAAGSTSSIHDHGGRHCWFVVLAGSLRVDDFERVDGCDVPGKATVTARGSRSLDTGGLDLRLGRYDIHRVSAELESVTLHVYSRPLNHFLVYDQSASTCRPERAEVDRSVQLFSDSPAL